MNEPAISVVTPLYNKELSISRSLESVLAQTLTNFEVVVVDDGSTDSSAARVRAFADPRVRLVEQPNRGAAAARNRGLQEARAPYIAFLDADDAWMPEFLATILALVKRYPQAGAYATGYYIKNQGQALRPARFEGVPVAPEGGVIPCYFRVVARGANPVWSSAVCVPRRTFEQVGGFPDGVRLYEDLHLWARIAISFPIAYCATPLSIYYRDAENRRGPVAKAATDLKFADAVLDAIADGRLSGQRARHAREFVSHYALLCAFKTLIAGNPGVARTIARSVVPEDARTEVRRTFVIGLSRLPRRIVLALWAAGRRLKRLAVRHGSKTPHPA